MRHFFLSAWCALLPLAQSCLPGRVCPATLPGGLIAPSRCSRQLPTSLQRAGSAAVPLAAIAKRADRHQPV